MAKVKTRFFCSDCGHESPKWVGRCPGCNSWNTMVEELKEKKTSNRYKAEDFKSKPQKMNDIQFNSSSRFLTKINELNRVLGGGIVPGSLVLIGGDPGIGKSTLLLQMAASVASKQNVLYVSGEESEVQIKSRAERLSVACDHLYLYSENDLLSVLKFVPSIEPNLIIIDSIQTVFSDDLSSAPGSVSQVRECTSQLMRLAKTSNIPIFIVGHVTKDGGIAGPRVLEHMVDTVLYFEGERHHTFRILRAVKNRYGSTNEIGIFDMNEKGLKEVLNPSGIFLEDRSVGYSGTAVVATMEGTRPVLVEVQSLLSPTSFGNPKRTSSGIDYNKLSLLIAVLEKRLGLLLQNQDAYIKVSGGIKLMEPAIDLALVTSILSSYKDQPTKRDDLFIGEVGLTGEVKRVSRIEERVKEAYKMGFKRAFIPKKNMSGWTAPDEIELVPLTSIDELLKIVFKGNNHF